MNDLRHAPHGSPSAAPSPSISVGITRGGLSHGPISMEDWFSKGFKIIPRYAWKLPYRQWTLYNLLIYYATYKPRTDPRFGMKLEAGQIVTTYSALASKLERSAKQVKIDLKNLVSMGVPLGLHGGTRHVVITIRHYKASQDLGSYKGSIEASSGLHKVSSKTAVQQDLSTTVHKTTDATRPADLKSNKNIKALINLWNDICGGVFPRVDKISTERKRHIRARLKELPDLEEWERVFRWMTKDAFHLGSSDGGWTAEFDYILRPDRALRILERIEGASAIAQKPEEPIVYSAQPVYTPRPPPQTDEERANSAKFLRELAKAARGKKL